MCIRDRIKSGEVKRPDFEIDPKGFYKDRRVITEKIKHINRIKSAYKRNGEQGVIDYFKWDIANRKKVNELVAEHKRLKSVPVFIQKIIDGGAAKFWTLISFFYAFLTSFTSVDEEEGD